MKKILIGLVMTLTLLLSACGSDPREESPTLNNLMGNNEDRNSKLKEGQIEYRFTNDTSIMEDYMVSNYKVLEEEFGDDFFVYISVLGGVAPDTDLEDFYSAYLVAKPGSETAELFKQYLDGEVNTSDWAILKQNMTESVYEVLFKDVEEEDRIDIFFYDPYLYDPPVLITFPNIHNKVLEYY